MNIRKVLKWTLSTLVVLVLVVVGFGYWFMGLIKVDLQSRSKTADETQPHELAYLAKDSIAFRGKLLAVVTSTSEIGTSGKTTGYELTELSRAYYVFTANGFEVDIASPKGGNPPVVIDDDDVDVYDFAFMNDPVAQAKATNTIALSEVSFDDYEGVYFVGGKGAMFDFPDNPVIQSLVQGYYESGKVVGAVCHGPAALANVTLSDGQPLLKNRKVSSFTNEEELFLIPNAIELFPFLLQDELASKGALFDAGSMYLANVVVDGNLITGQNPWSTWPLAEEMIRSLGYTPKTRIKTSEETSVQILLSYEADGYQGAKDLTQSIIASDIAINRELIAIHSITSGMQGELGKAIDLINLLRYLKNK